MLAELKKLHAEMHLALDALERLTRSDVPDETEVGIARVRLSRVSRRRRSLFDLACNHLLKTASEAEAQQVQALREINAAQVQASTAHVGSWSLRQVTADWDGYRRASIKMRQSLRDLMAADRETLYPLLERAAP